MAEVQKALHYSAGKSGVDQLPPDVLLAVADVYTYGGKKYARNNWMGGTDWHEFYGSALRHMLKWWNGEETDACLPDCTVDDEKGICLQHSNLPHLAHAIWNMGTLLFFQQHGMGTDDRMGTLIKDLIMKEIAAPRLSVDMGLDEKQLYDGRYWSEAEVELEESRIKAQSYTHWNTFPDGKFAGRPIPFTAWKRGKVID